MTNIGSWKSPYSYKYPPTTGPIEHPSPQIVSKIAYAIPDFSGKLQSVEFGIELACIYKHHTMQSLMVKQNTR